MFLGEGHVTRKNDKIYKIGRLKFCLHADFVVKRDNIGTMFSSAS